MDYLIRRTTDDLDSTGYIEVGPGRYTGKHWQPGFLFVWEDAFGMAEGIVARHLPEYDHFEMNDVAEEVGRAIIRDWRSAAERLGEAGPDEAAQLLNLDAAFRIGLEDELQAHRADVAAMLRELADACEQFYERERWICVLGM